MLNLNPTHWLLAFALGLLLELCLGEPKRFHPLVGFGWLASWLERRFNLSEKLYATTCRNIPENRHPRMFLSGIKQSRWIPAFAGMTKFWEALNILRGALAWLLLISASLAAFALLKNFTGWWADALALWFALGARSLFEHVRAIARPLSTGDLITARLALSRIVSRNCTELDDTGIAKAGLESTLENGADAIFASLFFFALFGGYGVLLHRLANTLDAMWGYKTVRLFHFGRIAARADDVLNFIPARLTALSYVLLGHSRSGFSCWQNQAPLWDSPNAGPVMASGAGALQVSLGGEATYHGEIHSRPQLGCGPVPTAHDLPRGIVLVQKTLALWIALLLGGALWLL
jgi:adenosylcobinamide-phosphate synthase